MSRPQPGNSRVGCACKRIRSGNVVVEVYSSFALVSIQADAEPSVNKLRAEFEDMVSMRIRDRIQPAPQTARFVRSGLAAKHIRTRSFTEARNRDRWESARRASANEAQAGVVRRSRRRRAVVRRRIRASAIVPAKTELIDPCRIGNPSPPRACHARANLKRRQPVRLCDIADGLQSGPVAIEKLRTQAMVLIQAVIDPSHAVIGTANGGEIDGKRGARRAVAE